MSSDSTLHEDGTPDPPAGRQTDLTVGPVLKTLLLFAVPFFIANILQALYGAVDLLVVGRFAKDSADVSAVACGSQTMTLLTFVIVGLSTAGTVIVGNFFGAKDHESVRRTIGTIFSSFVLVTFLVTAAMLVFASPLLRFLQTPPEAFDEAKEYIIICSCGSIFIAGYNICSAIMRGVGDSVTPMIIVGIACAANLLADMLLVGWCAMGPVGAAYATIGSQAVSMTFGLIAIKRHRALFDFKLKSFRIDWRVAEKLFVIGIPLAVQSTLIDFSFLLIFSFINAMGVAASAGYGICCRINSFTMLPAMSLGMALTAMVAQNLGAEKPQRAISAFRWGVLCAGACAVVCWSWMEFFPQTAFALFTRDKAVIEAGSLYMRSFCFDVLLVAFVFCANGLLNGSGHTRFTFVNNVVPTFLIRVPAAWWISRLPGATLWSIGWAAPLASTLSVVITLIYLKTGRWRIKRL
ncbi:MAG: MATE family efflux transporter [Thermoguttaceae bacterium]|nr:MATE family efflux transporter [Thermoguttaceae bacterium]